MKNLMKYDPATCAEKPYPSSPEEYRVYHGNIAWLYNPYTGEHRNAMDVGSDVFGLLIQNESQDVKSTTEEFTPITKQKLFDGVVLSKLTGAPISEIEKNSDGYWRKFTRNAAGQILTYETSEGYWDKFTYNVKNGAQASHETSDGFWSKSIYDCNGNEIFYENSCGAWKRVSYDAIGEILSYADHKTHGKLTDAVKYWRIDEKTN